MPSTSLKPSWENVRRVCDVPQHARLHRHLQRAVASPRHGPRYAGIPSCSIRQRAHQRDYGVKTLIRVGSCGAVREDVKLRDVVIGMGACTDPKVNRPALQKDHDFAAIADFCLV